MKAATPDRTYSRLLVALMRRHDLSRAEVSVYTGLTSAMVNRLLAHKGSAMTREAYEDLERQLTRNPPDPRRWTQRLRHLMEQHKLTRAETATLLDLPIPPKRHSNSTLDNWLRPGGNPMPYHRFEQLERRLAHRGASSKSDEGDSSSSSSSSVA